MACSDSRNFTLEGSWLGGRTGTLSPLSTVKAWALCKVYREFNVPEKKLYARVAAQVEKIGGGHPHGYAIKELCQKIDMDTAWYPGKVYGDVGGRPKALSRKQVRSLKRTAEQMKQDDIEPTYSMACSRNPEAVRNPDTYEPVSKRVVYRVYKTECFDPGQNEPWEHGARVQKTALPDEVCDKRLALVKHLIQLGRGAGWCHRNVIWLDFCNSIIPKTARRAKEQALARKANKGWRSPGATLYVRNLKGQKGALKMKSTDTVKWWWMPVLSRGKLHLELLPEAFPGECAEGATMAIARIPAILKALFGGDAKPRVVMTDKGKGFYHGSGRITDEYAAALEASGLRPLMGHDNVIQPGDCQELMLHETAVAWVRRKLERCLPAEPWTETRAEFKARLKTVAQQINKEYDVAGLTHEWPDRIEAVAAASGGRIKK